MKYFNIAILGATGAVGQTIMKVLEERNFPINSLKLLASKKSVGKAFTFKDETLYVEETTSSSFTGIDIVFGAAENEIAKQFTPDIIKAGAIMIDNSSAYRLDSNVPLVVPEVNGEDIKKHQGIIANPNCVTIIAMMAIYAIHQTSNIHKIIASTYQAVSGAGIGGINELNEQVQAYVNKETMPIKTFPYQILFNAIPQIGGFNEDGYSSEEMKLQNEGRKILHAPSMLVNCTCVRVPVLTAHCISMNLELEHPLEIDEVKTILKQANGVIVLDNPNEQLYPMPLNASNKNEVFVGRIRKDLTNKKGLTLWCCGDQLRKGAATNAIQIAEAYIKMFY